eukprot:gnl/Chilomastix_cuspidata/1513.p1 GENE.gnl/Chilomastix_cuspidata/1513~~gnl/Chilomastix_cuspidata/1513.p1  ORF type:complete len:420 (+),score=146.59 gnl/Chilomastix_cuspidata/1513:1323-2582(+)
MISLQYKRDIAILHGPPGTDRLEGTIKVESLTGKVIEYLSFRIVGKEAYKVEGTKEGGALFEIKSFVVIDKSQDLTPFVGGAGATIQSDEFFVGFQETLPAQLPQSCSLGDKFKISYSVIVSLKVLDAPVFQAEQPFYVMRAPVTFRFPGWDSPIVRELDIKVGFMGRAAIRLELPRAIFAVESEASEIPVRCVVENHGKFAIRCVKLSLHRHIKFGAASAPRVQEAQLAKKAFDCLIKPHETYDEVLHFHPAACLHEGVPRPPAPDEAIAPTGERALGSAMWSSLPPRELDADTFSGGRWSKLFTVEYSVRLMVSFKTSRNPTLFAPILFEQVPLPAALDMPPPADATPLPGPAAAARAQSDGYEAFTPDGYYESSSTSSLPIVEVQDMGGSDDTDEVGFIPAYAPIPPSGGPDESDW